MNRARKQRIRELNAQQKLKEQQELLANAERLKTMQAGFARSATKKQQRKEFVFKVPDRVEPFLPAKCDPVLALPEVPKLAKSVLANLEERERAAALKLAELKSRVAPAYNKGGYQYLGDSDIEDVKAGLTRRR